MSFFPTIENYEHIIMEVGMGSKKGHVKNPRAAKKRSMQRLCWARTTSLASPFEQALEILPSGTHKRLTIDPPQPTQKKPPHPMPVFAFRK